MTNMEAPISFVSRRSLEIKLISPKHYDTFPVNADIARCIFDMTHAAAGGRALRRDYMRITTSCAAAIFGLYKKRYFSYFCL